MILLLYHSRMEWLAIQFRYMAFDAETADVRQTLLSVAEIFEYLASEAVSAAQRDRDQPDKK